jgi:hypothetical protein
MSNHTLPRLGGALFAGLLVLASLGAPMAAFAADPVPADAQPIDPQPTEAAPSPDVLDDGFAGEVVYDPYFISPEPDGSSDATAEAPVDAVTGDIGRPALTPPATDTIPVTSGRQGGAGEPFILAVLAALSITVVALGRIPAARRP